MLLFLTLTMQAQKVSVSGQVLDSVTGEGIPFAGIFIKGTTTGVSTDDQGVFGVRGKTLCITHRFSVV